MGLYLVIIIVAVALIFDFLNGFHDAANSIATVVATKVLSPFQAVLWAAFFNFLAPFFFAPKVADTVANAIRTDIFTKHEVMIILLAGLCGAIMWNIITWYLGLPTSSSHALIGGLAGAGLTAAHIKVGSMQGVLQLGKIRPILFFIVLSPLIGMVLGFANMVIVSWLFRRSSPRKIDGWFRRLQLLSAAAYSFGHGTNDAQKTMGVISLLLIGAGFLTKTGHTIPVPTWVKLACAAAIALGTMSGGWRIVKTMGLGIVKLRPVGGFCAETAGAITLLSLSMHGIPVSTTHTITGAIVGVGSTQRLSAVKWGVAGRIVWAWILTMPMSALVSATVYLFIHACS